MLLAVLVGIGLRGWRIAGGSPATRPLTLKIRHYTEIREGATIIESSPGYANPMGTLLLIPEEAKGWHTWREGHYSRLVGA